MGNGSVIFFLEHDSDAYKYVTHMVSIATVLAIVTCYTFKVAATPEKKGTRREEINFDQRALDREQRMNTFTFNIVSGSSAALAISVAFILYCGGKSHHDSVIYHLKMWIMSSATELKKSPVSLVYWRRLVCTLLATVMYMNKVHLFLQNKVTALFREKISTYDSSDEVWGLRVNCVVEVIKFTVAYFSLVDIVLVMANSGVPGCIFAVFFVFFYYETLHIWNFMTVLTGASWKGVVKWLLALATPVLIQLLM